MNIPFVGRRSSTAPQITGTDWTKEQNKLLAPKHGPTRGRRVSEGQQRRAIRRQVAHNDAAAAGRRRRQAFLGAQRDRHQAQNLLGVARVYFDGAGTPAMQANVRAFVDRQAEVASKRTGEPFTTSRKRVEQLLLTVLTASDGGAR